MVEDLVEETAMMAITLTTLVAEETALATKTVWVVGLETKETRTLEASTTNSSNNNSSNSKVALAIRWEEVVVETLATKATTPLAMLAQVGSALPPAAATSVRSLVMGGRVRALADQVMEGRCRQE